MTEVVTEIIVNNFACESAQIVLTADWILYGYVSSVSAFNSFDQSNFHHHLSTLYLISEAFF